MNPLDDLIALFNQSKKNAKLLASPKIVNGKLATAGVDYDEELMNYINLNKLQINTDILAVLRYNPKDNRNVIYFEFSPSVVEKVESLGKEYKVSFNPDATFWTFESEANKEYYSGHANEVFNKFSATSSNLLLDSRTYNHPGIGKVNPALSLKDASNYIKQWL